MKQLVAMTKEAIQKYEELNLKLAQVYSDRIAVAGYDDFFDGVYDFRVTTKDESTLIFRNGYTAFINRSWGYVPVAISDNIVAFILVAIRTNSMRRELNGFKSKRLYETGMLPVRVLFMKRVGNILWQTELSTTRFSRIAGYNFSDEYAAATMDPCEYRPVQYRKDYIEKMDPNNKDILIDGNMVWRRVDTMNTWMLPEESKAIDSWKSQKDTYRIFGSHRDYAHVRGVGYDTVKVVMETLKLPSCIVATNHQTIYFWSAYDIKSYAKELAKTVKVGNGPKQREVNRLCKLVPDFQPELSVDVIYVEKVQNALEPTSVCRFFTNIGGEMRETFRTFVTKKSILKAVRLIDGTWKQTGAKLQDYNFTAELVPFENESVRGTKLDFLYGLLNDKAILAKVNTGRLLKESLESNLLEIAYKNRDVWNIVQPALMGNKHKTYSLRTFILQLFSNYASEPCGKTVENRSIYDYLGVTKPQYKMLMEWQKEYDKEGLFDKINKDRVNKASPCSWRNTNNAFIIMDEALPRYGRKYGKQNIQHLSNEEYEELIGLAKTAFLRDYINLTHIQLLNSLLKNNMALSRVKKFLDIGWKFAGVPVRNRHGANVKFSTLLVDTLNMLIGRNMSTDLNPRTADDVVRVHDMLVDLNNSERSWLRANVVTEEEFNEARKRWKKLEYNFGEYAIVAPSKRTSFTEEALALSHCVGSFLKPAVQGKTTVMFIRKKDDIDTPYFTMEVANNSIRQVHGKYNANVDSESELASFIQKYAKVKNLGMGDYGRALTAYRG